MENRDDCYDLKTDIGAIDMDRDGVLKLEHQVLYEFLAFWVRCESDVLRVIGKKWTTLDIKDTFDLRKGIFEFANRWIFIAYGKIGFQFAIHY